MADPEHGEYVPDAAGWFDVPDVLGAQLCGQSIAGRPAWQAEGALTPAPALSHFQRLIRSDSLKGNLS